MTQLSLISTLMMIFFFAAGGAQADFGFYQPKELPKEKRLDEKVLQAAWDATQSLKYKVPEEDEKKVGSKWITCSSVWISSDGYLLTALHCLTQPLLANELMQFKVEYKDSIPLFWLETAKILPSTRPDSGSETQSLNDILVGGSLSRFSYGVPQIVFLGRGVVDEATIIDPKKFTGEITDDEIKVRHEHNDDFAILKFDTRGEKTPCVPVAKESPAARGGDEIWSIGFPKINKSSKSITYGKTYAHLRECPACAEVADDTTREKWERIERLAVNPHALITDADGDHGMSGGPVFNRKGEVVGIFNSVSADDDMASPLSFSFDAAWVREQAKLQLKEKAELIFGCETN